MANTVTDVSTGPSDFFAGAVSILSLSPAADAILKGIDIDVNGFTNGAVLTAVVTKRVGSTDTARVETIRFVKDAGNTRWSIIDAITPIKGVATSFSITLQSSIVGDTAVTVPVTYYQ